MLKGSAFRGLTWDHPRGFNALDAASKRLDLTWDKHSLEGFETHPIADLCARYDLVVLDHPHVGEAVAADCLRPLEDIFTADDIATWSRDCIGPSLASYHFAGRHWALPLDAATQVMACRSDIDTVPVNWKDVLAAPSLVMSLSGPHAALTFQSICASLGDRCGGDTFVTRDTGEEAFDLLAQLTANSPEKLRDSNPIAILQYLCDHDDVALCPLVYGYVNYAPRLRFANAPSGPAGIGSTLGGTGIGISKKCELTPDLLDHLRWLMSPNTQIDFIPAHDGQPSLRAAWLDGGVNARWGAFYRNTFNTLEAAYVRPRHDGAIRFQTAASQRLRDALYDGTTRNLIDDLNALYEATQ
ncbi:integral membrane protein [Asticcacaulis biprosthecium C19]|uniref:Integral membrane protein n=1 Tax=Asticcacaulis biprosthecium C19 TaxID=715226 RepID=F4QSD0_9CAUL|nr:hypothetical protein [Asticcacaulis biprosthecium]EGF89650.1 integral membrane protein [Asticcacaulis biprosthecium C19]